MVISVLVLRKYLCAIKNKMITRMSLKYTIVLIGIFISMSVMKSFSQEVVNSMHRILVTLSAILAVGLKQELRIWDWRI